jgi:hypothetical protein
MLIERSNGLEICEEYSSARELMMDLPSKSRSTREVECFHYAHFHNLSCVSHSLDLLC